jgi:hypothetical protein
MAFDLSSLIGGSIGDAFQKIMGVFKVDPTIAAQNATEITKIQLELQGKLIDQVSAQLAVDQAEASNQRLFVAGWRPAIGWVCGLGLFVQFIVNPLATWGAALAKHPIAFPSLDLGTLMTLLLGMLGLGGMRTYEKVNSAPGADKLH